MIIGSELRQWLADKSAQRRSWQSSQAFAEDWNRGPVHQRIEASLAALAGASANVLADNLRGLFEDSGWIEDMIAALTAALQRDRFFKVPFRHLSGEINDGLVLYEDGLVSIALTTIGIGRLAAKKHLAHARRSILFSGQVEVLKIISGEEACLRFWKTAPVGADFSATTAGTCSPAEARSIHAGEILVVDGRRETFVIEQARSSLVLLQATVKPDRAPVSVEYDHETRAYLGCSAADDSASRIQMITSLLRQLGSRKALPAMAEFLDHDCFFLRWHVMREMIGLDPEAALPSLKRMAVRDPHPETRRAARIALDRLEAAQSRRKAA